MSVVLGLLKNWRLILGLLVSVGFALAAWHTKSRFDRADQADSLAKTAGELATKLDAEQKLRKQGDKDRVIMSAQLRDFEESSSIDKETVIKRVKVYVKDNRACDVPVEVLKSLNRAMGQPE